MGAKEGLMGIVSYKLTTTNDLLTPNAGLLCLAELLEKLELLENLKKGESLTHSLTDNFKSRDASCLF